MISQMTEAGRTAGHGSQVATGFGVAGTHQHAAIDRLQGKYVARLHQVFRSGMGRHGSLYGACAISGRNAGRDALGSLDGDRESRALLVTVARCHGGQLQAFAGLACQSQADQPATETGP
jgi:hypothetical protein